VPLCHVKSLLLAYQQIRTEANGFQYDSNVFRGDFYNINAMATTFPLELRTQVRALVMSVGRIEFERDEIYDDPQMPSIHRFSQLEKIVLVRECWLEGQFAPDRQIEKLLED